MMDLELVCTAALTGRKVGDPIFAGLETYSTDDLSAVIEPLKRVTQDLPAKKWPRYSVIVELSANSKPEHPEYTGGLRAAQVGLWSSSPRFSLTCHSRV
jgi:hypothetical protein